MSATEAMITQLRRMVKEPTEDTYNDAALATYIEQYPVMDERGVDPYYYDTTTDPPTQVTTVGWYSSYDLHAAASDIWEEKASDVIECDDVTIEDTTYRKSERHDRYLEFARFHRSRRTASTVELLKSPNESRRRGAVWVGNLAEEDY